MYIFNLYKNTLDSKYIIFNYYLLYNFFNIYTILYSYLLYCIDQ